MNNDYLITIKGSQIIDGENDSVEVMTVGAYEIKNGKKYIIYKEYVEDSSDPKTTIVKYENEDKVSITNPNRGESRLILEKSKRHLCHYNTPMGDLIVGVSTHNINSTLGDDGGVLEVSYSLDFNSDTASKNSFYIQVKKNDKKNQV